VTTPPDPAPAPVPAVPELLALDADAWASVLAATRVAVGTAVAELGVAEVPIVTELVRGPSSRFVAGRRRRALADALATTPGLWPAVATELARRGEGSAAIEALLVPSPPASASPGPQDRTGAHGQPQDDGASEVLDGIRERLRRVREERDAWRRRAEGASARAERAEAEAARLRGELDELAAQLRSLQDAVAAAGVDRDRALARAARRHDTEVARLREEVAALRRAEEDRRLAARRSAAEREAAARAAERRDAAERQAERERGAVRLVPGRPSRLPRGVRADTTEAARLLLHRGRLVLLDGYNISLQHRGALELERQRTWLVQLAASLVAARGIEPVVVFDGERSGGGRPAAGLRGVEVRFTERGITADDEIVLAVEATDRPVVVVTDDRELRARVGAAGADVLGTTAFLGVAS
jgi:hypothetical protein